jgi:hypothetical protein
MRELGHLTPIECIIRSEDGSDIDSSVVNPTCSNCEEAMPTDSPPTNTKSSAPCSAVLRADYPTGRARKKPVPT